METIIQIQFDHLSEEQKNILIAELESAGFHGFEEGEENLIAFISTNDFDINVLKDISNRYQLSYSKSEVEEKNWNEEWEKNFDPVRVDDFVAIRANFHPPQKNTEHEIIITPKMSFGTGHHATTFLMMQAMRKIDFVNKSVFDFGTGTGVLAILAEKKGSVKIFAIDNDEWSINNATENIAVNLCDHIKIKLSDKIECDSDFDIVLANINKNIILENLAALAEITNPNGLLLLSGLLKEDQEEMTKAIQKFPLILSDITEKNNWICISLKKGDN